MERWREGEREREGGKERVKPRGGRTKKMTEYVSL